MARGYTANPVPPRDRAKPIRNNDRAEPFVVIYGAALVYVPHQAPRRGARQPMLGKTSFRTRPLKAGAWPWRCRH